jgi:hypothetical protein
MSSGLHVLIGSVLRGECTSASLTLELGRPMSQSSHVLLTRTMAAEYPRARLAGTPMIVILHVLITIGLGVELVVTSGTFVHLGVVIALTNPA